MLTAVTLASWKSSQTNLKWKLPPQKLVYEASQRHFEARQSITSLEKKKHNQRLNVKLIEMSWLQLNGQCIAQNDNEEPAENKPYIGS